MHQRYCTSSCIYEQEQKTSEQNKNKYVRRKKERKKERMLTCVFSLSFKSI